MLDEGYGQFIFGRFTQTLEYRRDKFPEQPVAGPFFANLGGFLMGLLFGFTGIDPNSGRVEDWSRRRVNLPDGWKAIEVDRLWIKGKPMALRAVQGELASFTDLAK
jgi:hypothetical protein